IVQQPAPRKWHGTPGFISWPRMVPSTQPSQHAVQLPHWRCSATATGITAPQHFLYFLPLPQGHGSLRPTLILRRSVYSSHPGESRSAYRNMTVYLVVLMALLNSIAQRGAKMAVSLYALELGAGAAAVGVLAALFAVFPLLLAVQAGRISDRYGMRMPIALGGILMAAGLVLPIVVGGLPALFLCPALLGLGHIYFHVSIHNL